MTTPSFAISTEPALLLASDESQTSSLLRQTLESWRYQVERVSSGSEAMARLDSPLPPGLAFLDMSLTHPGALEIVSRLNGRPESRRTWIILTGKDLPEANLSATLQAGGDDFLPLPASADDLRLRIRIAERVRSMTAQLQKQSAELRYQATHDGLTGLWNREALVSLIFQETDRVQRMKSDLSLMILDLDDFSRLNHDFGYEAGDRILTGLANRFRRQMRSYDLLGRCGEDEFLLALPGCGRDSALTLANRIREDLIAPPFMLRDQPVTLHASFGIAVSRGRAPMVVLREAEHALSEAKMAGKDCARCYGTGEQGRFEDLLSASLSPAPLTIV